MTMTDLSTLEMPAGLSEHLPGTSRSVAIVQHRVKIKPEWWLGVLSEHRLAGGPVLADGKSGAGEPTLSRGALFSLARTAATSTDDDDILRLLWHVLAWGTGTGGRNNRRRIQSVAQDPAAAVDVLRQACATAKTDPLSAYTRLRPGRHNAITWLGPAFFTKLLYFAGEGASSHEAFILDDRVAGALRDRCGWDSLRTGSGWPPPTYARYCALLTDWAQQLSDSLKRDIVADEIEFWLFQQGPVKDVRRPRSHPSRLGA